ncbi:hypothetical protein JZ968_06510 [Riemerella anatipestifer]|nr:hypothetical protein [Riemerella anatipestifer]
MKSTFVIEGKRKMNGYVMKAIEDLLDILDSPIVFPTDKFGNIQEHKILPIVKSREQVFVSASNLMDLIKIDNRSFIDRILEGLKTTWEELTLLVERDIGEELRGVGKDGDVVKMRDDSVSDNYLSSVAQAKELAAIVAFKILDRIYLLEDPEAANEEILKNQQTSNIIERYASI